MSERGLLDDLDHFDDSDDASDEACPVCGQEYVHARTITGDAGDLRADMTYCRRKKPDDALTNADTYEVFVHE